MNKLAVLVQIRLVINVVQDHALLVVTFDLKALNSTHHSFFGTNNTFFGERIRKVLWCGFAVC